MSEKPHRNIVQISTSTDEKFDEAFSELKHRELIYNRDKKELGIKVDDKLVVPKPKVGSSFTFNSNDELALAGNITIGSITSSNNKGQSKWCAQSLLGVTTSTRTIILICKKDDSKSSGSIALFGGEIAEIGDSVESHYQVSLTSTGSRLIKGATTNSYKAKPCYVKYKGTYYYGIKFKSSSPANIYHVGWKKIPSALAAPSYTSYTDSSFSEIVDLDDESEASVNGVTGRIWTNDNLTFSLSGSVLTITFK